MKIQWPSTRAEYIRNCMMQGYAVPYSAEICPPVYLDPKRDCVSTRLESFFTHPLPVTSAHLLIIVSAKAVHKKSGSVSEPQGVTRSDLPKLIAEANTVSLELLPLRCSEVVVADAAAGGCWDSYKMSAGIYSDALQYLYECSLEEASELSVDPGVLVPPALHSYRLEDMQALVTWLARCRLYSGADLDKTYYEKEKAYGSKSIQEG